MAQDLTNMRKHIRPIQFGVNVTHGVFGEFIKA